MRSSAYAPILDELRRAGAKDVTLLQRTRHPRLQWVGVHGPRFYVLPGSPSDWRSLANARADVRRILRQDGMLPVEAPKPPRQPTPVERLRRRVKELEAELRRYASD